MSSGTSTSAAATSDGSTFMYVKAAKAIKGALARGERRLERLMVCPAAPSPVNSAKANAGQSFARRLLENGWVASRRVFQHAMSHLLHAAAFTTLLGVVTPFARRLGG